MFYYLFYYLDMTFDIPGVRIFNYISFRAILAFIIAMFIAMHFGKKIIRYLQQKQIGETIRDLGLEGQMSKKAHQPWEASSSSSPHWFLVSF